MLDSSFYCYKRSLPCSDNCQTVFLCERLPRFLCAYISVKRKQSMSRKTQHLFSTFFIENTESVKKFQKIGMYWEDNVTQLFAPNTPILCQPAPINMSTKHPLPVTACTCVRYLVHYARMYQYSSPVPLPFVQILCLFNPFF